MRTSHGRQRFRGGNHLRFTLSRLAGLALVATFALLVSTAAASEPPAQSITVPSALDQTVTVTWTGTILPGANAQSSCHDPSTSVADSHAITVTVPAGAYDSATADFTFSISWTDDAEVNDEILTVVNSANEEIGSSDGSSTTESVGRENLRADTYRVLGCAFASPVPQDYVGKLEIHTHAPVVAASAPAQGLSFSSAIAADPQRDESEPLITIDHAGLMYTCGPSRFSQSAD